MTDNDPDLATIELEAASIDYMDVLWPLFAEDIPAQMINFGGQLLILVNMVGTTGFYFIGSPDGGPLPYELAQVEGWALTCYVPEEDDPDNRLDFGACLYTTDDPDYNTLAGVVIPTVRAITEAIVAGRAA